MKIVTKFNINQKVNIPEIKIQGVVQSIWILPQGIKYEVRYFDNAKVNTVFFFEHELSEIK